MLRTFDDFIACGANVRIWCFRCARGNWWTADVVQSMVRYRGGSDDVGASARYFRCRECRQTDQVVLLPMLSGRKPLKPKPRFREEEDPAKANTALVEAFFHGMRAEAKRRRRGW